MNSKDFEKLKYYIMLPIMEKMQNLNSSLNLKGSNKVSDSYFNNINKEITHYQNETEKHANSTILDRHKLSAIICGSIIKARPFQDSGTFRLPNETLAVLTALENMRPFIIESYFESIKNHKMKTSALKDFEISFPNVMIKDKKNYVSNLILALNRSVSIQCSDDSCDKFDIWAYAKIFYHLELHNIEKLKIFCEKWEEEQILKASNI